MALIKFEDLPSTKTPWNADNVNHNFKELDNKVGTTIWTGALQGGQSTTLNNVKRFLKVFARTNGRLTLIYYIDSAEYDLSYGSTLGLDFDDLDRFVSQSSYNKTTGEFTHTKTGYFGSTNNTFSEQNNSRFYVVYRIDTFD